MSRFEQVSAAAVGMAIIDSAGGMLGLWSVTGGDAQRLTITAFEAVTMLLLLANSVAIWRSVHAAAEMVHLRTVATLCTLSLLVCLGGDVVNFNLPQSYYRHGDLIRHDYLADSVMFFAPGYSLLLAAVVLAWRTTGRPYWPLIVGLGVAAGVGLLTFSSMHLPGTGTYVTAITGGYSIVITAVGISGVLLVWACGGVRARAGIWCVGGGLLLANLADAVIGQFWIYGNSGEGFFPIAREANWILYVGSQALVIHLPRVLGSAQAAEEAA